jgi:hypothetical protein
MLTLNVTGIEAAIEKSKSEVLHSYSYDTVGCKLHAILPFLLAEGTVDHKS